MSWQQLGDCLPRRSNPLTRWLGRGVFAGMGWRIEGEFPNRSKVVVALVPHSSNMDFLLTVAVLWGLGLKSAFLMKHSLFWFPLGGLLRWLGGIPVDRRRAGGMVGQMVEEFSRRPRLVLGITPEGTRSKVAEFKQGFARIATEAKVPVLPAVLNYRTKTVRFAPLIEGIASVEEIVRRVQAEAATGTTRA
jgi:1-acyl-sn-glycerol-3-phosphate acyltransferase